MNKYVLCVVSKEYRWVEIEAEDDVQAIDMVWGDIENIMSGKPEDYDTDVYVESHEPVKAKNVEETITLHTDVTEEQMIEIFKKGI